MSIVEIVIVNSSNDKLPLFLNIFKRSLKYEKKNISLEILANHLQVIKEFCIQDGNNKDDTYVLNLQVIEKTQSCESTNKRKNQSNDSKRKTNDKYKKGKYHFCHKKGHNKYKCHL